MTDRLKKIYQKIPRCETFADIGCDHGYIAKAMLMGSKCKNVIVSDVSEKCLAKAQTLLSRFIENGVARSVVSDGFDKVGRCDCALIAGMGGEEICSILDRARKTASLPENLVLQPMKNCDKVRKCALSNGYFFVSDAVFYSAGKYYNLIVLKKGDDFLSDEEIEFGRDNVKNPSPDFKKMIKEEYLKLSKFLENESISQSVREELLQKTEKLEKYV